MKINIRKCLLACMASMTLISFTAYGSEQSDQDQILREIAERIAASGDIPVSYTHLDVYKRQR